MSAASSRDVVIYRYMLMGLVAFSIILYVWMVIVVTIDGISPYNT